MLAGPERVDDLPVVPVVGRADAHGVDVLVGEHVGVIDVPLRLDAGLLLDEVADRVFLLLVDLAHGDEVDVRPLAPKFRERLHMGAETAATGADEADPQPAVGVGRRGGRGSGGEGPCGHSGGTEEPTAGQVSGGGLGGDDRLGHRGTPRSG